MEITRTGNLINESVESLEKKIKFKNSNKSSYVLIRDDIAKK